ncbi:MAG TPA: type II toxin-antitoxin system VapC family toxin [Phycisphaerae bacterium]|nr:type II toxin-antitoxin system VapC family toxin [Phycisphaerae bacterium]HRY70885.1 type II toxin-antitoxin system VapC family toxin [Phycisphaerae bacterium]HSA30104.1 type II toxin-antitoxin system VapC family toxin [Phycisphaerae bacterium]
MVYADTDFIVALTKEPDWLKAPAEALLAKYPGEIWISPATLIELMLVSVRMNLDPVQAVRDALQVGKLLEGNPDTFVLAATYVKAKRAGVFDALHAAYCGPKHSILSSDKVFDRLGLKRILLEQEQGHSDEEAVGEGRE